MTTNETLIVIVLAIALIAILLRSWFASRVRKQASGMAQQVFPVWAAQGPFESGKESAAAMWRAVEGPKVRLLWDLREARFNLDATDVHDLAAFVRGLVSASNVRTAFVTSRAHLQCLLRAHHTALID